MGAPCCRNGSLEQLLEITVYKELGRTGQVVYQKVKMATGQWARAMDREDGRTYERGEKRRSERSYLLLEMQTRV